MSNPPPATNSLLLFGRPINTFVALGGLGCLLLILCLCFVVVMPLFLGTYATIRATRTPALPITQSQDLAVPATASPTPPPLPTATTAPIRAASATATIAPSRTPMPLTATAPATAASSGPCPQGCALATPPAGCLIKGNINAGEKIYHVPGGASYPQTKIDPSKGERWFCTEDEARANGWRKAQN